MSEIDFAPAVLQTIMQRVGMGVPRLTIGIPTYRRNYQLLNAVESALNQKTDIPYEVLISDNDPNNSIDWSGLDIPPYVHFRHVRQCENLGMVGNWNSLLRTANSGYLSILCDDDALHPLFVQRLVKAWEVVGDADMIQFPSKNVCGAAVFGGESLDIVIKDRYFFVDMPAALLSSVNCNIAAAIKVSSALAVDGFRPEEYPSFDHLMVKRLVNQGFRVYQVTSPLEGGYYQVTGNTSSELEIQKKFLRIDVDANRQLLNGRSKISKVLLRILEARSSIQIARLGMSAEVESEFRRELNIVGTMRLWEEFLSLSGSLIVRYSRWCRSQIFAKTGGNHG